MERPKSELWKCDVGFASGKSCCKDEVKITIIINNNNNNTLT